MTKIYYEEVERGVIDPNRVRLDASYQRGEEILRTKEIKQCMQQLGAFDLSRPIVINMSDQVVDGGHRNRAAIELGYKEIPYLRYKFKTQQDEINYFNMCQRSKRGMTARDQLWAQKIADNPYANLVYSICTNRICDLYNRHDLKLEPHSKSSHDKIKVENICYIINNIVLEQKSGWGKNNIQRLSNKVETYQQHNNLANAVISINRFLDFFFGVFGNSTRKRDNQYREAFLNACLTLYTDYLKPKEKFRENKKERERVIKKLQRLTVDSSITKNHKDYIVNNILREYINRRVSRVENCY